MLQRMRAMSAGVLGFSLVGALACGSEGSDQGSSAQGSGVTEGGGTTGTTSGETASDTVAGSSGGTSAGGAAASGTTGGGATGTTTASTSSVTSTGGQSGAGGGAGTGEAGSGGAGSDLVDCSLTDACSAGEVCVPNATGCAATLGQCFEASDAFCGGGSVCGCDGVVYDDRCDAYSARVSIANVSECEQPAGTIACFDRYCDASRESCQVVNDSRCDGGCFALCPGRHTVTYGACVPALTSCDGAECDCPTCFPPAVSCSEGADGFTLVCTAGCYG